MMDSELEGIDLQTWRVPPPPALDRPSLVSRALAPAAVSPKRSRLRWLLVAAMLLNVVMATLVVILLVRPTHTTVAVQAAGGGSTDEQVRILLQRLEQEQRELERRLAEVEQLHALILELSEKLRRYEERDRTVPKPPRERPTPERVDVPPPPADQGGCDEVSCVLTNIEGPCCAKYKRGAPTRKPPAASDLPDSLDRASISNGIAAVKSRVATCGRQPGAKGMVKVRVRVGADGRVTNVDVHETPDAALGACVAGAVRRAVFPRTHQGGSFSYPFVF